MPEDNRVAKKHALDDLNAIEKLKKLPEWTNYWCVHVIARVNEARDKVLQKETQPAELEHSKMKYLIWKEVAEMLGVDEAACRSILEGSSRED
jgi:hypothetical protein